MTLGALAAVPAAPLVLRAAVPTAPAALVDPIAALRADVQAAADTLRSTDAVVLLAAGTEPLVHDATRSTLTSYGIDHAVAITGDDALLGAVAARSQAPRVRDDRLDGDLAVLALILAEADVGVPAVAVTVPGLADPDALGGVAAAIQGAAAAVEREVGVLVAADLAATLDVDSPGYRVDGADEWDRAARAAVEAGDVAAFRTLGPAEAARVQARGWGPLLVLLTLLASTRRRVGRVAYHAPRRVGGLVVTSSGG